MQIFASPCIKIWEKQLSRAISRAHNRAAVSAISELVVGKLLDQQWITNPASSLATAAMVKPFLLVAASTLNFTEFGGGADHLGRTSRRALQHVAGFKILKCSITLGNSIWISQVIIDDIGAAKNISILSVTSLIIFNLQYSRHNDKINGCYF